MKAFLFGLLILQLCGCVRVMSDAEINGAVKRCIAQGGEPELQRSVDNYVIGVRCYFTQRITP